MPSRKTIAIFSELELAKLSLSMRVLKVIEHELMSDEEICAILGISFHRWIDLVTLNIDEFEIFELLRFLNFLGLDVSINISSSKNSQNKKIVVEQFEEDVVCEALDVICVSEQLSQKDS